MTYERNMMVPPNSHATNETGTAFVNAAQEAYIRTDTSQLSRAGTEPPATSVGRNHEGQVTSVEHGNSDTTFSYNKDGSVGSVTYETWPEHVAGVPFVPGGPYEERLKVRPGDNVTVQPDGSWSIHYREGNEMVVSANGLCTAYDAQGRVTGIGFDPTNPGSDVKFMYGPDGKVDAYESNGELCMLPPGTELTPGGEAGTFTFTHADGSREVVNLNKDANNGGNDSLSSAAVKDTTCYDENGKVVATGTFEDNGIQCGHTTWENPPSQDPGSPLTIPVMVEHGRFIAESPHQYVSPLPPDQQTPQPQPGWQSVPTLHVEDMAALNRT